MKSTDDHLQPDISKLTVGIVIVIVISRLLKRYLKAKRTRATVYSRAMRRIKGGPKWRSRKASVRYPEGQKGVTPCLAHEGVNLQATKLFIVTWATKGGGYHPPRFSVRFKILYRVIQALIYHCLLRNMVYLNIIYVIATRNYDFFLLPA